MSQKAYLQNHFLIAMPQLEDPSFQQSVVYLCEHNENGAVGLIINRPMTATVGDILSDMNLSFEDHELMHHAILFGGPAHTERGFVLHETPGPWRSMLYVNEGIFVTTSRDILEAAAKQQGPEKLVVALGCAAWTAGQLEQEILANFWLSLPADKSLIFNLPYDKRYEQALARLGVNLTNLSAEVGHG